MKPVPQKIEDRLKALMQIKEFDEREAEYCRCTYWQDRDGWHTILINCFDRAQARRAA